MASFLPQKMRAIQMKAFGAPYTISDVDVPRPKPYQVLVQIKAAGYCHSDCMVHEGALNSPLPLIGSHEPAGIVAQVGSRVTEFKIGDRVGCINFENCCGVCPDCRAGRPSYCDRPLMKGVTTDGAWAEYMVADHRFTVKLPDVIDFPTAACLMCAGISIYGAIKKANVPPGGSIGILGVGGLGHIGTQLGKAMGYQVVAIDAKQDALDLVLSYPLKPDLAILASSPIESAMQSIGRAIKGYYPGLDATIVATDAAAAVEYAASITRKHGTLVLVGLPAGGVNIPWQSLVYRDLKLIGSMAGEKEDAEELVHLVADHGIRVHMKTWRLHQAEEMRLEYLKGTGSGKNVISFE